MKSKTVFWSIWTTFVVINVALMFFFALKTGIKTYLVPTCIVTFGAGGFIFLVLKHGFMISKGRYIRRNENPVQFYGDVVLLFVIYLVMLFMATCLYLQEIGYLPAKITRAKAQQLDSRRLGAKFAHIFQEMPERSRYHHVLTTF